MRIKVLASGSKGNSTYIECGSTKILIDAGISFLQIKNSLSSINVDVNDIRRWNRNTRTVTPGQRLKLIGS